MKEPEPLACPAARYKMRRLTDDEMATLRIIARKGRTGPALALTRLWDLILRDAHGISYDQAGDRPYLFRVQNYAVAADQSANLFAAMTKRRRLDKRTINGIGLMWFNDSPADYEHPTTARVTPLRQPAAVAHHDVLHWMVATAARALKAVDSLAAKRFDALVSDVNNLSLQNACRNALRKEKDVWADQYEPGPQRTKIWGVLWAAECTLADVINARQPDPDTIEGLCGLWRDGLPTDIAICLVVEGATATDAIDIAALITKL